MTNLPFIIISTIKNPIISGRLFRGNDIVHVCINYGCFVK